MQETGNNVIANDKILSIRLWLNGLYFSCGNSTNQSKELILEGIGSDRERMLATIQENGLTNGDFERVNICLSTPKTIIIPREAYSPDLAQSFMELNGYSVLDSETIVASSSELPVVTLAAWNSEVILLMSELYKSAEFTTPMIELFDVAAKNSVTIDLGETHLCLVAKKSDVEYAESLEYSSLADIIYYIESVKDIFGREKASIFLSGHDAEKMVAQLKKHYSKVFFRK